MKETQATHNNRFEEGLAARRDVLGDDHVRRAMENATPFGQPMQNLIVEYCWGGIWTRPGLERRTRSLINLAMLTALNRPHELEIHLRGALNNGCTEEEIQETLLQAAVYAGIPAAVDAFRVAASVLKSRASGGAPAGDQEG